MDKAPVSPAPPLNEGFKRHPICQRKIICMVGDNNLGFNSGFSEHFLTECDQLGIKIGYRFNVIVDRPFSCFALFSCNVAR